MPKKSGSRYTEEFKAEAIQLENPRAFVERLTDAMCYTVKWLKSSYWTFVNKG